MVLKKYLALPMLPQITQLLIDSRQADKMLPSLFKIGDTTVRSFFSVENEAQLRVA